MYLIFLKKMYFISFWILLHSILYFTACCSIFYKSWIFFFFSMLTGSAKQWEGEGLVICF